MLITFKCSNFLSFNDKIEFSMLAGAVREHSGHVIATGGRNGSTILKSGILYGANASGKSNLIKAIDFAQNMILKGVRESITHNKYFRLDAENIKKNSEFEFEFKVGDKIYAYGFSVHLVTKKFIEEWFFEVGKTKDKPIFERKVLADGTSDIKVELKLDREGETRFSVYKKDILDNQLFFKEINEKNIKNIKNANAFIEAYHWFEHQLEILYPNSIEHIDLLEIKTSQDIFSNMLDFFKTGINGLSSKNVAIEDIKVPNNVLKEIETILQKQDRVHVVADFPLKKERYTFFKTNGGELKTVRLLTKHFIRNSPKNDTIDFELNEESDGTQRIMDFIPMLNSLSMEKKVLIVDELDRSLHCELTRKILEIFFITSENVESQLIATTHDANLLDFDLLRRDEIWFVEKNNLGESIIFSLEEFKPRGDNQIQKRYLQGRFGGIPNIGSVQSLDFFQKNKKNTPNA
jgi:AAA15 family ATPase/GTPase